MDKRAVAAAFRERLQALLGEERGGVAGFLRDTGIDRSALEPVPRPRHRPHAARRDAAPHRRGARRHRRLAAQPLERAGGAAGGHAFGADRIGAVAGGRLADRPVAPGGGGDEAALRAVEPARHARPRRRRARARAGARRPAGEHPRRLPPRRDGRRDRHAGADAARTSRRAPASGAGSTPASAAASSPTWRRPAPRPTRRCGCTSTTAAHTFAAPFTVFGRFRAALYLGEAYLVVTSAEQVAALTRLFDNLVRRAVVGPERVQDMLYELADGA